MTETPPVTAKTASSFALDCAIEHEGKVAFAEGTEITVRKPMGGALRGSNLGGLIRMDFDQVRLVAPRITEPVLHPHLIDAMDPADVSQLAGEIVDFLLPKAAKAALYPAT